MISDAHALALWVFDAEYAVFCGDAATVDRLAALAACPMTDAALERGETFYLEEAMRLLKAQVRDTLTVDSTTADRRAWLCRKEATEREAAALLGFHADAMQRARAFVAAERGELRVQPALTLVTGERRKRERRMSAADRALAIHSGDDAA